MIILVHGYQGSEFDLRLYKNYIAKIFLKAYVLISEANSIEKDASLDLMGKRLSDEILVFIKDKKMEKIKNISFIGHSLGGVVIRAALPHLESLKQKMTTFISLCSPHLGCQVNESVLIHLGLKLLKNIKNSAVLKQLDLTDFDQLEDTFLYKLSIQ